MNKPGDFVVGRPTDVMQAISMAGGLTPFASPGSILVGTERPRLFQEVRELLENPASYRAMSQARNPYGDGQAAIRIV